MLSSGLDFLLLLLAFLQEGWRLELLFLLGWGFGWRTLGGVTLGFGRQSGGSGVVGGKSLHPFLQLLRCLLLLLTTVLNGRRVTLIRLCCEDG